MPLAAADGLGGTLHERLLPAKEQPGPSDPATQQSPPLAHSDDGRDGTGDQAGDKAKSYWRPSWVVRSLVNAVTFQASWSAGYAAAQLYYSALVIDLGVPNFVTVGPKDMLATAVPRRTALRAFGISMFVHSPCTIPPPLSLSLSLQFRSLPRGAVSSWRACRGC